MNVTAVADPSTIDSARGLLVDAQGIAADAISDPAASGQKVLARGASFAQHAAYLLELSEPRSDWHDLAGAAALAREGSNQLLFASRAFSDDPPDQSALDMVRNRAKVAFHDFEQSFEYIDND